MYFVAVFARSGGSWRVHEVDVRELPDADAVVDLLRDAESGEPGVPGLLVVEREDEWFAVARLTPDEDLKVFVSDTYGAAHSELGDVLTPTGRAGEIAGAATGDAGNGGTARIAVPGGDTDVLAELGMPPEELLALCEEEGVLPADALSVIAERVGAGEAYDGLR